MYLKHVMKRFAETDIDALLDNKSSKNTRYNDDYAFRLFNAFLKRSNLNFEEVVANYSQFDSVLANFFASVRKENGDEFQANSLVCLRHAIKRKLSIDILKNGAFKKSTEVFDAVLIDLKRKGKAVVKHYDIISSNDLILIKECLFILRSISS